MESIFGNVINNLSNSLDVRAMRHRLILSNVANQYTVGYRPLDIDFKTTMKSVMGQKMQGGLTTTNSKHIQKSLSPGTKVFEVRADDANSIGNDSNAVDIDRELGKLRENSLMYELMTRLTAYKFRHIKQVIRGE